MINLTNSLHSLTRQGSSVLHDSSSSSSSNLSSPSVAAITDSRRFRFDVTMPEKMAESLARVMDQRATQIVSEAVQSVSHIKENLQTVTTQLSIVVAELENAKDQASEERTKYQSLEANLEKAEKIVENIRCEIEGLTKESQELQRGREEMGNIFRNTDRVPEIARELVIQSLNDRADHYEKMIPEKEETLKQAQIDYSTVQALLDQAKETLESARQRYESCNEKHLQLTQRKKEIEDQLEQSQKFHKSCAAAALQVHTITTGFSTPTQSAPLISRSVSLNNLQMSSNEMEIDPSISSSIPPSQTIQPSSRAASLISGTKRKNLATVDETCGQKKQKVSGLTEEEIEIGEEFYSKFGTDKHGETCVLVGEQKVFGPWMDQGTPYVLLRDTEPQPQNTSRFFVVKVTGYPKKRKEWYSTNEKEEREAMKIFLFVNSEEPKGTLFEISRRFDLIPLPLNAQERARELRKLKSTTLPDGRVAYSLERKAKQGLGRTASRRGSKSLLVGQNES